MKAKDFDRKFDQGQEDIFDDLDLSSARRVNQSSFAGNKPWMRWNQLPKGKWLMRVKYTIG